MGAERFRIRRREEGGRRRWEEEEEEEGGEGGECPRIEIDRWFVCLFSTHPPASRFLFLERRIFSS